MKQLSFLVNLSALALALALELDEAVATCGGSLQAYVELAQTFVEHAPRLEQALDEADGPVELSSVVHEVATCLQIVGAAAAGRRARELEVALREEREIDVVAALAVLRGDLGGAVGAVRRVIAESGNDVAGPSEHRTEF